MVKVLVVLQKKEGMTRAEFRRYWRDVHGPIGARMPGVRRYVQNHVLADGAPFDGVAEMWFESPANKSVWRKRRCFWPSRGFHPTQTVSN